MRGPDRRGQSGPATCRACSRPTPRPTRPSISISTARRRRRSASRSATCSPRCRRRSAATSSIISTCSAAPGRSICRPRRRTGAIFGALEDLHPQRKRRDGAAAVDCRPRTVTGPQVITRYNNYRSVTINGGPAPGVASGTAWPPWRRCPARRCRLATPSNGPARPIRSSRPAARPVIDARPGGAVRLPVPGRALRELDHPDSGAVLGGRLACSARIVGILIARLTLDLYAPDRARRSDCAGGEERHPDRRVRQGAA